MGGGGEVLSGEFFSSCEQLLARGTRGFDVVDPWFVGRAEPSVFVGYRKHPVSTMEDLIGIEIRR